MLQLARLEVIRHGGGAIRADHVRARAVAGELGWSGRGHPNGPALVTTDGRVSRPTGRGLTAGCHDDCGEDRRDDYADA